MIAMAQTPQPPPTELERQKRWKERGDAFWGIFLPTKNGRVKSTLVLNSFCLSILFLAVYAMAYLLLLDGLDAFLAGKMPLFWINVLESLIPALIGTFVCNVLHFVFAEKRLVPAAFVWLLLYAVAVTAYLLAYSPAEARGTTLKLLMMVVPPCVLSGCALSAFLYLRHRKLHPPSSPMKELPPWKQNRR